MAGKTTDQVIVDMLLQQQARLTELVGHVGGIGSKLDTFISQMAAHDTRTTDIEVRTRKVEARQHWYSGAGAVVGLLLGKFAPGLFGHT
jgi:hypothetical protein